MLPLIAGIIALIVIFGLWIAFARVVATFDISVTVTRKTNRYTDRLVK